MKLPSCKCFYIRTASRFDSLLMCSSHFAMLHPVRSTVVIRLVEYHLPDWDKARPTVQAAPGDLRR